MKKTLLSAALAVSAMSAFAAPETYVTEPNHTYPRFSYTHLGYSQQQSRFDKASGTVVIDRDAKKGSVDIVIDTTSVSTGSKDFNEHIQAEDFLDTAKYPTATYKSTKLVFKGDTLVGVDGELTLKGVTKPVKLDVTAFHCAPHPRFKKDACGANATVTVKRSDFNMGKYVPLVSDEVTIAIAIEAIKQ